jgi:hypothetical protein
MKGSTGVAERGRHAPSFEELYTELRERICLLVYPPGAMLSERTNVTNETRRVEDRQEMTAWCRLG